MLNPEILLFIAIIGLAIFILTSGLRQSLISKTKQAPVSNSYSNEEPLIIGFQLVEYDSGKKIFTLDADKLYIRNKRIKPFGFRIALAKSGELENVVVTFYKDNKPVSYLHSKSAIMVDVNKKDFIFQDKPFLSAESKVSLTANEISWHNAEKCLSAKDGYLTDADGNISLFRNIRCDPELKTFK